MLTKHKEASRCKKEAKIQVNTHKRIQTADTEKFEGDELNERKNRNS